MENRMNCLEKATNRHGRKGKSDGKEKKRKMRRKMNLTTNTTQSVINFYLIYQVQMKNATDCASLTMNRWYLTLISALLCIITNGK